MSGCVRGVSACEREREREVYYKWYSRNNITRQLPYCQDKNSQVTNNKLISCNISCQYHFLFFSELFHYNDLRQFVNISDHLSSHCSNFVNIICLWIYIQFMFFSISVGTRNYWVMLQTTCYVFKTWVMFQKTVFWCITQSFGT